MCPNCRAFVTTSDRKCPYCEVPLGPRAIDRRNPGEILGGLIPHARFTTTMILLVNFVLYAADYFSQGSIERWGASMPAMLMDGQWWRLITAGFLHGSILHILMNSWALFGLGSEVEQLYGTSRMIVFYFISTVSGFYLSSHTGHFSVGSSAGIFGLIGAMFAFGITDKSHFGSLVKAQYTQWLIWGILISVIPGLGVDLMAHVGGVAGGFVAAYLASTPRARLMWKEPLIRALAGISVLVTAVAFGMLYLAISHA